MPPASRSRRERAECSTAETQWSWDTDHGGIGNCCVVDGLMPRW